MMEDEDDKLLNDAIKVAQDERAASGLSDVPGRVSPPVCSRPLTRSFKDEAAKVGSLEELKFEEDGQDDHEIKGVCGDIGFHTDEAAAEIPKDDGSDQWDILKSGADVARAPLGPATGKRWWEHGPPLIPSESLNLFYEPAPVLAATEVKKIRVAADTGACAHCTGPDDLPHGCKIDEVEQRNFVGPNGQAIDHFGEAAIRLEQPNGSHVSMRTQVMGVTRPLHSVSMICDGSGSPNKHNMLFTEKAGYVVPAGVFDEVMKAAAAAGKIIAKYPRDGGLYVAEMIVKCPKANDPAPFAGQRTSR
jgi:hypothetical protein